MKTIYIQGYWNDNQAPLSARCIVNGEPTEDDDDVFYYFEDGEEIIGNHGDFTVTGFEND